MPKNLLILIEKYAKNTRIIIRENKQVNVKDKILANFKNGKLTQKTEKEIAAALGIHRGEQKDLIKILRGLCDEGLLCRDGRGRFGTPEQMGAMIGTVSAHRNGFAFLIPEDRKKYPADFFIPRRGMNGALHGDRVSVLRRQSAHSDDEVEVIRILSRGYFQIVGTFVQDRQGCFLRPDEEKFTKDIFIPRGKTMGAVNGSKAIARITSYPQGKAPGGEIIEILGRSGDFFTEELALIRAHDLREEFPEKVYREAAAAPLSVPESAMQGRLDLRDKLIVTVDGEDTRDIDDAVSVERNKENYILGVHIADVSHYVPFRGILDEEAYKRATSVYFPDRVLPMLPKELSNGICSLNEGVDRLALSCIMEIDAEGKVVKRKIARSVIRSAHRMTYHQVEDIARGMPEAIAAFPDVVGLVKDAFALTDILKAMRRKKGEIELDVKEAKIMFDAAGKIVIPDYERLKSQEMIEQFMVLANETVAEFMTEKKAPFVYRIHEKPKPEKAEELKNFLISIGVPAPYDPADVKPENYRAILKNAEGMPVASVINRVMLRSMMKARYDSVNAGHFGLSSACYCHFTSPIRRYPDLCIHRIIKLVLKGQDDEARKKYGSFVSEASVQSSECERKAVEAERDVDDLYKTVYMSDRVGQDFDGVISGVTSHGFFVELPNTVEGFVPYASLPEDEYEYFEERFLLRGKANSFRIGDEVRVRVAGVDFGSREVDFHFLQKLKEIG